MSDQSSEQWWFCLRHQTVEHGPGCPNSDRLGPYATEAEAANALQRAAERNEEWDSDPRWKDAEE